MSGDGRLDLDELGGVLDHAAALDAPDRAEVLDDGRGRTWGERLEDAGITPWLRRHRVAVGSVAAVAVLASTGVVAFRTVVPPPLDPELRVTITPVLPSLYVSGESAEVFDQVGIVPMGTSLRSAYALSTADGSSGDTYTIERLSGPGVRASSASRQPSPSGGVAGQVARQDVDVVADCFDPDVIGSVPDAYTLVVSRTDDHGRTITRALPLPAGGPDWSTYLTASCLQTQAMFGLTPQSVTVSVDRAAHVVSADVVVSNTLDQPATVAVAYQYGLTTVVPSMPTTQLAAKRGAVLPLRLDVRDCAAPALNFVGLPTFLGDQRYDGGAPGVYLSVVFPRALVDPQNDPIWGDGQARAPLVFPADQTRVIEDAMRSMCDGAPSATLRVRDVGVVSRVAGVFANGNPVSTRFPVTLAVTAAGADRVRVTSPATLPDTTQTTLVAPVTARVIDDRATVRTWIDIDCQSGYAPPPTAQVEVTTSRGSFPLQVPVNDAGLTASVAANCPELPLQQLLDFGWAAPA